MRAEKFTLFPERLPRKRPSFLPSRCMSVFSALPERCLAGGSVDISLLIRVETWYWRSSQMSAIMKSGAPISRFFFSRSLMRTTSTSLCVRSSSLRSPVSSVMLGRTVTGGIGSIVSTNHSGLPPFIFMSAASSSLIFSSLCRTSSDVSSRRPSLKEVGFWNSSSFCFSPQCGQVIFLFL